MTSETDAQGKDRGHDPVHGRVAGLAGVGRLDRNDRSMVMNNPRIPADEREVFAMAWMIGYIGWVPDDLQAAFREESFDTVPGFIPPDLVHEWKRGYDNGLAFFCDHKLDEE